MSVVLVGNGSPTTRVRVAGVALLVLMALGVLCAAVRHRSDVSAESAARHYAPPAQLALAPLTDPALIAGTATFYAEEFQGRIMASGRAFDLDDPSIAAANQWPLGTRLRLRRAPGGPWDATLTPAERDLYFNSAVIVTVQDHGDFTHALDLSRAAFSQLGRPEEGVIRLLIEPIPEAPQPQQAVVGR